MLSSSTKRIPSSQAWMPCLNTDVASPLVQISRRTLSKALGGEVRPTTVKFGTDGAYAAEKGVPTIIFGPGEPGMAHVRDERIELGQMREALGALTEVTVALLREGV